jgi:hypothetical protein
MALQASTLSEAVHALLGLVKTPAKTALVQSCGEIVRPFHHVYVAYSECFRLGSLGQAWVVETRSDAPFTERGHGIPDSLGDILCGSSMAHRCPIDSIGIVHDLQALRVSTSVYAPTKQAGSILSTSHAEASCNRTSPPFSLAVCRQVLRSRGHCGPTISVIHIKLEHVNPFRQCCLALSDEFNRVRYHRAFHSVPRAVSTDLRQYRNR